MSRELKKYMWQQEVGFRITGFKVYDITCDNYHIQDKTYGRSLHPSDVPDALKVSVMYSSVM